MKTRCNRRAILAGAIGAAVPLIARADSLQVPARLQSDLLVKVVPYDRNFAARAGARAKVLLVSKSNDVDSGVFVTDLKNALSAVPTFGAVAHDEESVVYAAPQAIAEKCRSLPASILYLAPGFSTSQIEAIRDAVADYDLLTVAAVPDYVPAGIVLGFDLVYGKPKLLVNLPQARRQHVDFSASLLKLAKIYE